MKLATSVVMSLIVIVFAPASATAAPDSMCAPKGSHGTSECVDDVDCTDDGPSQVVDKAVYCATNGADFAVTFAQYMAGYVADCINELQSCVPDEIPKSCEDQEILDPSYCDAPNELIDTVNEVLCEDVWAYFCSNPIPHV